MIHEGQTDAPLFTLLDGWAFRFKTLRDGRRQILSFLLPGDFIGVQQRTGDAAAHGVDTLTDAVFCVFQRDALWELHRQQPSMGFNINTTWPMAWACRWCTPTRPCASWSGAACTGLRKGGCTCVT